MDGVSLIVRPAGYGWKVDGRRANLEPLLFASRAASEAHACALAVGFAIAGRHARVIVRDQLNRLVHMDDYPALQATFESLLPQGVSEG